MNVCNVFNNYSVNFYNRVIRERVWGETTDICENLGFQAKSGNKCS